MKTATQSFRHYRVGETMDLAKKSRRYSSESEAASVAKARGQNVYEYDQHGCVGEVPSAENADRPLNP